MCGKSYDKEYPLFLSNGISLSFCQNCLESMLSELKAQNAKQTKQSSPQSEVAYMLSRMFGIPIVDDDLDDDSIISDEEKSDEIKNLTPRELMTELNRYVIGQDKAKKTLAVAIYNHCKRMESGRTDIEKSNIMLIGSTGVGKTELARTIAKIMNVPFAIADSTGITEAGYVGGNVEDIVMNLVNACNGDIERAERGIIYIDEIDKLASYNDGHKDVSGEGVQQALLKIIEGTKLNLSGGNPRKAPKVIDTSNILFICGGAFAGLTMKEKSTKHALGFNSVDEKAEDDKIDTKALSKFGMIPELLGRFPIKVRLDDLEINDLKRILVEPENSIVKQYKNLLNMDGVELAFGDSALQYIAEKAKESGNGARGLRSVIEDSMTDLMFDLPDMKDVKKVTIVKQKDGLGYRVTRTKEVNA